MLPWTNTMEMAELQGIMTIKLKLKGTVSSLLQVTYMYTGSSTHKGHNTTTKGMRWEGKGKKGKGKDRQEVDKSSGSTRSYIHTYTHTYTHFLISYSLMAQHSPS